MDIELSSDQQAAFDTVMDALKTPGVQVLVGPAGSGKTTLLRIILDAVRAQGREVVQGAPTGKAALRLGQVTGYGAETMHKLLYKRVKEDEQGNAKFTDASPPCYPGGLVVIDEASMVGSDLFNDFQSQVPSTANVLYAGDREQLEPVKDTWGPDLRNPTAALTEVHRQALESPILAYATAVRMGHGDEWSNTHYDPDDHRLQVYTGLDSARDWLLHQREQDADATLVAYTHNSRRWLNETVRGALGLDTAPVSPGDKLVVKANHKHTGLRNGEIVTVTDVDIGEEYATVMIDEFYEPIYIVLDHIEADPKAHFAWKREQWERHKAGRGSWSMAMRVVHVHYGQCLTVHSAQGSQWSRVGFVWDEDYARLKKRKKLEAKRLLYTAATRAIDELMIAMED